MITPPSIQSGDTIGIVACGRKVSLHDIEAALTIFKSWGLKIELAKNIFSNDHSYLAGTDAQRLSDFQSMIDNPSIKTIICARGGYGSTRIVDDIDFAPLMKNPKWIVGFSDITAIHLKLLSLGIKGVHGTMPIMFSKATSLHSIESLKNTLFTIPDSLHSAEHVLNKEGTSKGELIGGNLSLIVESLGTSSEPDTTGNILVIEEIEEYRYKIDRMINQLKRAGKLDKLAGIVVGHMTNILDDALSFNETAENIIYNHTQGFNYPVAFQFPIGHENPNLAWVHGATATLTVTKNEASLKYL